MVQKVHAEVPSPRKTGGKKTIPEYNYAMAA